MMLFSRPNLEILLTLVRERRTYVVKHTQAPQPVRDALRDLEDQLVALLAAPDFRAAVARDIQLGKTSEQIRDEIIAKVGMMAAARTAKMQARYDAAVERERQLEAARNLEPDDCNIAAVGGARRCSSCGRPGGGHEVDCRRVQRLEREKLQAECDHQSGTVTRTTGDPPGPPCCGRCGLELPERGLANADQSSICITVTGPQNSPTLPIARAILELLQGTDVTCSMPEEAENPYDGDSIEQLGNLRGCPRVIVQTCGLK